MNSISPSPWEHNLSCQLFCHPAQPLWLLSFVALGLLLASPSQAQTHSAMLDFNLPQSNPKRQTLQLTSESSLSFIPSKAKTPEIKPRSTPTVMTSHAEQFKAPSLAAPKLDPRIQALFQGGSNSIVALAVGSAEGTRTPQGDRTWAYHGHRDPGNGQWNLGSFSYQHQASSPAEADKKQLKRLHLQAQQLQQLAAQQQLQLSLSEALNGIDLANQAPLAALDRGYIPRLQEARQLSLSEAEGILYARTWSYWDPDLDQWNAPGLGNQWLSISEDQQRRQAAIAQALELHVFE